MSVQRVAVVVGNPKPASRTLSAATYVATELTLRPVLAELGATTVRGHYVLDSAYDDPAAYADWLESVRPVVAALAPQPTGVTT